MTKRRHFGKVSTLSFLAVTVVGCDLYVDADRERANQDKRDAGAMRDAALPDGAAPDGFPFACDLVDTAMAGADVTPWKFGDPIFIGAGCELLEVEYRVDAETAKAIEDASSIFVCTSNEVGRFKCEVPLQGEWISVDGALMAEICAVTLVIEPPNLVACVVLL